MGRPVGIPKTGVFGLLDLVGIDLMPHVAASMAATLPAGDPYARRCRDTPLISRMIAEGYTGRKGKGGFYRLSQRAAARVKEAIDLSTGDYRAERQGRVSTASPPQAGLRRAGAHPDRGGALRLGVLSETLAYAAALVPEIADDIAAVDEAMRLGYNWKFGPVRADRPARRRLARRAAGGRGPAGAGAARDWRGSGRSTASQDGQLQYLGPTAATTPVAAPTGVLLLADVKRRGKPLARNGSAALWDIGDGVPASSSQQDERAGRRHIALIGKAIALVAKRHQGAGDLQRGRATSRSAPISASPCSPPTSRLWPQIEELVGRASRPTRR